MEVRWMARSGVEREARFTLLNAIFIKIWKHPISNIIND